MGNKVFFPKINFQETDYKMKVDELLNNNESYKIKCENFASQLTSINTTHELEIKNFKSQVFYLIFVNFLLLFYNSKYKRKTKK